MAENKSLMQVENIHLSLDNRPVLVDLSLTLNTGEWLGILGESGSGKSTLLRLMARLIDADQGEVRFEGEVLTPVKNELIPGHPAIKLIHQEYALFPNQTVTENIGYSLRFYEPEYRAQRVEELLQLSGLQQVQNKKSKRLSGGEKQRTAIARALAEEPTILLLDEPFAHLDSPNKRILANAIESMRVSTEMGCVFVTHEATDALAWSDRIAVLKAGEIVQLGTPQEVYQNPVSAYVAELTGPVNWIRVDGEQRIFIRPEWVRIAVKQQPELWKGQVASVRFLGAHWLIRCQNEQGAISFYHPSPDLYPGQNIALTYSEDNLIAVSS
ncbi:ABC transporter ATP-binding protein [Dyadobacter tibetensis]|uniref:ABC transporter ATP-binding protein n=1 Tax=Dyadobacter tibetensis TaxID=1211851 RepID=UPI0005C59F6D|nr:ABC transporter ATP-binding protein [Dyadobacter tibetensis]